MRKHVLWFLAQILLQCVSGPLLKHLYFYEKNKVIFSKKNACLARGTHSDRISNIYYLLGRQVIILYIYIVTNERTNLLHTTFKRQKVHKENTTYFCD